MSELPKGWEAVSLAGLASKIGSGATPRGGEQVYKSAGTPLIRSMNVYIEGFRTVGLAFLDDDQAAALRGATVRAGDVLLNITGASIGRVTQAPPEMDGARVNQHVCIIRLNEKAHPTFIARYLASPQVQSFIAGENYGVTRQALTKQMVEALEIPLPPLPVQHRVVSKLDSLFDHSKRAREELGRIPKLVERYKQAVLEKAFGDAESIADTSTTLGNICEEIRNGVSRKPENIPPGIPILKISAVRSMSIRMEERRYYNPEVHEDVSRYLLRHGDLLFTRYNGNPHLVANCGMFRAPVADGTIIYPDKLIRVRVDCAVADPEFVEAMAASPQARKILTPHIKSAAGQHGISGGGP